MVGSNLWHPIRDRRGYWLNRLLPIEPLLDFVQTGTFSVFEQVVYHWAWAYHKSHLVGEQPTRNPDQEEIHCKEKPRQQILSNSLWDWRGNALNLRDVIAGRSRIPFFP